MRIAALLLKYCAIGLGVVAVLLLGGREAVLFASTYALDGTIKKLQTNWETPTNYSDDCHRAFPEILISEDPVVAFQLRFLDDTSYNAELVCAGHTREPITLSAGKLLPTVTKVAGSSGIYMPVDKPYYSSFVLNAGGRTAVVDAEHQREQAPIERVDITHYPVTACAGWGYQCCNQTTQFPDGVAASEPVTDCAAQCFSSCKSRPQVLVFRTDPFFDLETRITQVNPATPRVDFNYVVADADGSVASVTLDYGDGNVDTFTEISKVSTHQYTCATNLCTYNAILTIKDNDGLSAPNMPINSIKIVVTR